MLNTFTNRLAKENSPYLLQHAHNPVDWYPWGEEALQKAKNENKVILVSIGYSACHWCHVMEKESFENEVVAAQMNEDFINIKIDREERPDLDHIYMDALQTMTGSGGWPLNVFLTPDAKPFYGGTYFPPIKAYNRASWSEVLASIKKAWHERKNEMEAQAENLLTHLQQSNSFGQLVSLTADSVFTKSQCSLMCENILKQADTEWGGFGKAPKFPQTFTIQYLFQHHYYTGNASALQQGLLSIDKIIEGGIYDHVGGGFSRYSTDNEWLAPHFEKMLYDNALLINILCDAFQLTGKKKYEIAIRNTIEFVIRELANEDGGFYAALDADSEGEEGKFYVWSKFEIDQVLESDSPIFCEFYDVSENGNWDEKNILRTLKDVDNFSFQKNLSVNTFEATLKICIQKLFHHRSKRIRPATDDKLLLGWNALMITALCKAAAALNEDRYRQLAEDTLAFILLKFRINKNQADCWHTFKEGIAKYPAFLDDYAYLAQACINLQEITSNVEYLYTAKEITTFVIENFMDESSGYFFFTHKNQQDVIIRKKEIYDGAVPSGNSVMAENLIYLSVIFNEKYWQLTAEKMIQALQSGIVKHPTSFGIWASLFQKITFGIQEIVVVGPEMRKHLNLLLKEYLPSKILQSSIHENSDFPLLKGKNNSTDTLIYMCKQYTCNEPVNSVEKLVKQIAIQGIF